MGSPKFQIGGSSFPIDRKTRFSFDVMPTTSGGTLVRHRTKATIDVLHGPGVMKGAKKIRIDLQRVLGRGKKIILHQDVVRIGDQIFKRVGHVTDDPRPAEQTKSEKSAAIKRPAKK